MCIHILLLRVIALTNFLVPYHLNILTPIICLYYLLNMLRWTYAQAEQPISLLDYSVESDQTDYRLYFADVEDEAQYTYEKASEKLE